MPDPEQGEEHDEFISRCMSDPESIRDFPNEDDRLGFCESQWDENMTDSKQNWYQIKAQAGGDSAAVDIFGDIVSSKLFEDETGAKEFLDELSSLNVSRIDLTINSPGGSVFAGVGIYNALLRHSARVDVHIDGLAASIASVIAMAGDSVTMADTALMMIHDPFTLAMGNAEQLRKDAEILDKVKETLINAYQNKSTLSRDEIAAAMADETWLSAAEALEFGFVDSIFRGQQVAATVDPGRYFKTPRRVATTNRQEEKPMTKQRKGGACSVKAGEALASRLNGLIEEQATEERTESDIRSEMASAAGIDESTLSDILTGEIVCPPLNRLEGFAEVLDVSVGELTSAGESDGCDYSSSDNSNQRGDSVMSKEAQATAATDEARQKVRAEEKERIDGIKAVFDRFPNLTNLRQECVEDLDCTVEMATQKALDKLSEGAEPLGSDVRVTQDASDKFRDGASQAILARAGVEKPDPSNEFRGSGFLGLAQAALDRGGERPRGYSKDAIINAAITSSTSDYPNILEDVLHKTLLDAFRRAPRTWSEWTRTGDLTDFRDHSRHKPGSISNLKKLKENGELEHTTMPDSVKETISADERGLIVPLSHAMMVNDDVGYFTQMAQELGRAASLTIEKAVYDLLIANPTLNENGNALFSTANNNLAGTGTAITAKSVASARAAIRKQKDPSGNEFIAPRISTLLVPEELWDTAQQVMTSNVDPSKSNQTRNIVQNLADVVSTPYLSNDSATAWYLLADPQDAPLIEVGFVNGEQEPRIDEREAFQSRGLQWRITHDWGVAAIGFRGGYKDPGA